ncbi:hypothetical protein BH11MYX3_BH11MYX3_08830 [soil metagenome]
MVHPYRKEPGIAGEAAAPGEEWLLAVVLVLLGAVRVVIAVVSGETFEADVTIAAIVGAIGMILLAQLSMRAARAPAR